MNPKSWSLQALSLITAAVVAATGCGASETTAPATTTRSSRNAVTAVVYRSPTCGCCKSYEEYLRRHAFSVRSEETDEMDSVKSEQGIPQDAEACHTTVIGDYVVEGHVPVEAIEKLLDERPDIDGIAVPGMPANSPGMGEPNGEPLEVLSVNDGQTAAFTST